MNSDQTPPQPQSDAQPSGDISSTPVTPTINQPPTQPVTAQPTVIPPSEETAKRMTIGDEAMPNPAASSSFTPPKKDHKFLSNLLFVIGLLLAFGVAVYALLSVI